MTERQNKYVGNGKGLKGTRARCIYKSLFRHVVAKWQR